jgi:hypothetical protein
MPATPFFHIGLLAPDIDAAKEALSELLGVSFRETLTFPVVFERGSERTTYEVISTFSNEGPPFIELVQEHDDGGPLSRTDSVGLSHIGLWEASLEERVNALRALGAPHAHRAFRESGMAVGVFLSPRDVHGAGIELSPYRPELRGYTPRLPGSNQ